MWFLTKWKEVDKKSIRMKIKKEFLLTFVLAHCYYLGVTIERIGSHRVCGCLTVLMVALMSYSSHCHYCCCHVERIRRRYHLDVNMMGLVVDCWEYLVCLCETKVKEKTFLKKWNLTNVCLNLDQNKKWKERAHAFEWMKCISSKWSSCRCLCVHRVW